MSDRVPVLIAGGGPVGLATALFLTHFGIRPVVVEKHPSTSPYHRCSTSMRTLELFRACGLGPTLDRMGWVNYGPSRAVYRDSAVGTTLAESEAPPAYVRRLETGTPVESRMVPQDQLEKVLVEQIHRRGGTVRFGTRLAGLTAGSSGVRAHLVGTGTGERSELTADYLIGTDGANSEVRNLLGIGMPDREVAGHLTTAFYRADLGPIVHRWRAHLCLVRNPAVYSTMYAYDGHDRWSTHLLDYPGKPDGPDALGPARTLELLRATLGDDRVPLDLISSNPWVAQLGIASAFRVGRVFLAGDAAHVQTSAGGLGMNTGIQDGHNLAWKLAAVVHGHASPALLDTYEPERRTAAEASVGLSRTQFRAFVGNEDSAESVYETTAIEYLRAMMFYRYRSAAVLVGDGDEDELGVLDDDARPGYRLPHAWLEADGGRVSTVDVVGTGWRLLAGPDGHKWLSAAAEVQASLGVDLRARLVTRSSGGDALGDPDGTFAGVAGIGAEGALLVRPDGFVAWRCARGSADPTRALAGSVRAVLGRPGA